jgi:AraC family transcriptional regulator
MSETKTIESGRPLLPVTHGADRRTTIVACFRLTEAVYTPGLTVGFHEHALPSWTYVVSGVFQETFRQDAHTCEAGALLSKPEHANHANRYGPSGALCLLIEIADLSSIRGAGHGIFDRVSLHLTGPVVALARSVRRKFAHSVDSAPIEIEALLLELAAAIARAPTPDIRAERVWLRRTRDRLAEEFASPPSLDDLATDAGVHKVYLCQAFRAAYGCSPGEFVRERRVEYGRHLLATSDTSISAIALATGHSDQSHFTRRFQDALGTTPAQFRQHTMRPKQ